MTTVAVWSTLAASAVVTTFATPAAVMVPVAAVMVTAFAAPARFLPTLTAITTFAAPAAALITIVARSPVLSTVAAAMPVSIVCLVWAAARGTPDRRENTEISHTDSGDFKWLQRP